MACIFIPLGIIIAAVPENTTSKYKLTAQELLNEIRSGEQFMSSDYIADQLIGGDESIQIIDIRTPSEYEKYSLPGAINIPFSKILDDEWIDYLDQDIKTNVFYSNGSLKANEAWMILRQLGYENNYVLQGGLNYWAETILNPQNPGTSVADDEIAKYDLRKGASIVFGSSTSPITSTKVTKQKPKKIIKRKKKKRAAGGC